MRAQRSTALILGIVALGLSMAVPAGGATLNGGTTDGATSVAIVPMGHLQDPANRFFQMFTQVGSSWRNSTTVGVGTNAGIVVAAPANGLVAVPPWGTSKLTAVSGLRAGRQRIGASGEVLPRLVTGPSSISVDPTSGVAAAVTFDGSVLSWNRLDPTPRRIGTTFALAHSAAGKRCGVATLTAVAVTQTGSVVVGAQCSKSGEIGLFERTASGQWVDEGHLPLGASSVVRLDADGAGVSGLVLTTRSPSSLHSFSVVRAADGLVASTIGEGLSLHGRVLRSTDLSAEGPPSYVVATIGGATVRAWAMSPGSPVASLGPALGSSVQAVVGTPSSSGGGSSNEITALGVAGGTLTFLTLNASKTRWTTNQVLHVAIPYGSAA